PSPVSNLFFFFQAEDGIRDLYVTGVQTCALPISWRRVAAAAMVLSFVPCVWLAVSHLMGGGWPEAWALMAMHMVVWAICVTLLQIGRASCRGRRWVWEGSEV